MARPSAISTAGDTVWRTEPLERRETYEKRTCLIGELPLIGRLDLRETVRQALPAHQHPGTYEVHLVHTGSLEMWIEFQANTHTVRGGMAILTHPGQRHGGVDGLINRARFCWLQFRAPVLPGRPMPGLSVRQTRELLRPFAADMPPVFKYSPATEACFERLFEEHRQRRPDSVVMARSILHDMIALLGREYQAGYLQSRPHEALLSLPIRNAIRWLNANLGEEASVARMAEAAGMGERHFRSRFLRELGFTPADYLTRRLIERARELLQQSDRSITDIALELGFSTPAYFASVFRKHTGQTPTERRVRR